ncbi:unnamed protein product, partial [Ectocarpus sp. 8 AP-2014]
MATPPPPVTTLFDESPPTTSPSPIEQQLAKSSQCRMTSTTQDEMPLAAVVRAWRADPQRDLARERADNSLDQVVGLAQPTRFRDIVTTEAECRVMIRILQRIFGQPIRQVRTVGGGAGNKVAQLASKAQEIFFSAKSINRPPALRQSLEFTRSFKQDLFGAHVDRFVKNKEWPEEPSPSDDSKITRCNNVLHSVDRELGDETLSVTQSGAQPTSAAPSSARGRMRVGLRTYGGSTATNTNATTGSGRSSAASSADGPPSSGVRRRMSTRPAEGSFPARAARLADPVDARDSRRDQCRASSEARRAANLRSLQLSMGTSDSGSSSTSTTPPPPSPSAATNEESQAPVSTQAAAIGAPAPRPSNTAASPTYS